MDIYLVCGTSFFLNEEGPKCAFEKGNLAQAQAQHQDRSNVGHTLATYQAKSSIKQSPSPKHTRELYYIVP